MQQQQSQSIARIGEPFIGGLGRCGSAPAPPPLDCCKLCGCKKSPKDLNEKNLCPKCAEVEKLMGECFDETNMVDLSGYVGQRDELRTHFYFQDDPPWP